MTDCEDAKPNVEALLDDELYDDEIGAQEWMTQIEQQLAEQGYGKRVKRLALDDITLCKPLFQPRDGINASHVGKLQAAIRNSEGGVEPLLVLPVGGTYYLVDGFHRYEAYCAEGWNSKVPIACVMVSVKKAQRLSMQSNSQDKLPLTNSEKQNCAWRLVVAKNGSKAEQCKASGVSDGQIAMMRRAAKALGDTACSNDAWWQAREAWELMKSGDEQVMEEVFEDRAWEKAERWARGMSKGIPSHATEDMLAFSRAIQLIAGHRLPAMLQEIDLTGQGYKLLPFDEPEPDF